MAKRKAVKARRQPRLDPEICLTARQARFCAEYLIDLNATQAAIRAGYAADSANVEGSRLLANADISAIVEAGKARQIASAELSAARVLEEYRRLAFFDGRSIFTPEGKLKPIGEWTEEQGAMLAGVEVIIKNAEAGDGVVDVVHKIKLWSKDKALENLAKHFALLTEVVKVEDESNQIAKLMAGRARAAAAKAGK